MHTTEEVRPSVLARCNAASVCNWIREREREMRERERDEREREISERKRHERVREMREREIREREKERGREREREIHAHRGMSVRMRTPVCSGIRYTAREHAQQCQSPPCAHIQTHRAMYVCMHVCVCVCKF